MRMRLGLFVYIMTHSCVMWLVYTWHDSFSQYFTMRCRMKLWKSVQCRVNQSCHIQMRFVTYELHMTPHSEVIWERVMSCINKSINYGRILIHKWQNSFIYDTICYMKEFCHLWMRIISDKTHSHMTRFVIEVTKLIHIRHDLLHDLFWTNRVIYEWVLSLI